MRLNRTRAYGVTNDHRHHLAAVHTPTVRSQLEEMSGGLDDCDGEIDERGLWQFVLEGFRRALEVADDDHPERACLLRCHRLVAELAGRPPLAAVDATPETS